MRYEFPPRPPQGWDIVEDSHADWVEHEYCLIGTGNGSQSKIFPKDKLRDTATISAYVTEKTYGDYGLIARFKDNDNYILARVATWFRDAIIYEKLNGKYIERSRVMLPDSFNLPAVHELSVAGSLASFTIDQGLGEPPVVTTATVSLSDPGYTGVRVNHGSVYFYYVDIKP